jgi:hypothetical protein
MVKKLKKFNIGYLELADELGELFLLQPGLLVDILDQVRVLVVLQPAGTEAEVLDQPIRTSHFLINNYMISKSISYIW